MLSLSSVNTFKRTRFNDGRDWFFENRFGLFVHWGLYAIPAWHEQYPYRKSVSRTEYGKYIEQFNPVEFNPHRWLDIAEDAGMQYLCFTAKHVDGFCLWNTAQTDYNIMNTPYAKDVLMMLAKACHERGFPLCLYYSIADMHHPNFPSFGGAYERLAPEPEDKPDRGKYFAFVEAQIKELCSNYGKISGFWWDGNVIEYNEPHLNNLIRSLQPTAVINCRGGDLGDYDLAEREWNKEIGGLSTFKRPLEGCDSVGCESWGWKTDEDYFSIGYLTRNIDRIMARGGNYLLNIGPDGLGRFPERPAWILDKVGVWYKSVKEAFIGTEPAPELSGDPDVLISKSGNTIYAHLLAPKCDRLILPLINKLPLRSILLNNGQELEARLDITPRRFRETNCLRIRKLPLDKLANETLVVKIEFDKLPKIKESAYVEEEG